MQRQLIYVLIDHCEGRKMRQRSIVITGAGSGIGRATAQRFSGAGDRVILVGRQEVALKETADQIRIKCENTEVHVHSADVSDIDAVSKLVSKIDQKWGSIAGIICCAGSAPPSGADEVLGEIAAEWDAAWHANVMTSVLTVEGLLPLMDDTGSIVLFSSIAAYRGSGGSGAYGAAKAALHSYAHTLATRVGKRGINVNVIAPGYVADTDFFGDRIDETRQAMLIGQTALGRAGTPEDIANTSFFLCSPEGAYLTSQVLQVNGGSNHGV